MNLQEVVLNATFQIFRNIFSFHKGLELPLEVSFGGLPDAATDTRTGIGRLDLCQGGALPVQALQARGAALGFRIVLIRALPVTGAASRLPTSGLIALAQTTATGPGLRLAEFFCQSLEPSLGRALPSQATELLAHLV